jgi:hypothetical protein
MKNDREAFNSRVQHDKEGNKLNPLKLDGVESTDVKVLAAKLAHINDHATTQGEHFRTGTLYGFNLLVKTENSQKEGVLFKQMKEREISNTPATTAISPATRNWRLIISCMLWKKSLH